MTPTFIVIGAQKSASTFIQKCLADHPEIYMPNGETPFFESPDYENGDFANFEKIFKNRTEKCLGIKRPNYIGKMEVPGRIEKHLPESKLIAILRNPIDRAISAYFHNINYGFVPPFDLEDGMRKLISDPSYSKDYLRSPEIIEFGMYYKHLTEYKHFLKNNNLLVFLHEDIVSKPLESIRKSYEFLDVERDFTPKSLKSTPQKVIYNVKRLKFIRNRNSYMYDYNEDITRLSIKNKSIIDKIIAGSITMIDQKILSLFYPNVKPKVDPELRRDLYKIYADDIDLLEGLIDRDLSSWKV